VPSISPSNSPSSSPSYAPSYAPSSTPTETPPCPAQTLTIADITGDDEQCSIDYDDMPIRVTRHNRERDCVQFEIDQAWVDPEVEYMFVNFTDCDRPTIPQCQKRIDVEWYEDVGPMTVKCTDESAIVQVYLRDDVLSITDEASIPNQCSAPSQDAPTCVWTFEIACECSNPNCFQENIACIDNADCCSESCFKGYCAPYQLK